MRQRLRPAIEKSESYPSGPEDGERRWAIAVQRTEMKSIVLLIMLFSIFQRPVQAIQQSRTLSDENLVRDTVVIRQVLKSVKTHVLTVTKDRKHPLVVKDGRKSRRFLVREFLDKITRDKNIYTAQLDTDEFDHLIPRILYVDVRASRGTYKVIRIRDRKSTRLNSSHSDRSRMPSSA